MNTASAKAPLYKWRNKYGDLEVNEARRLKSLEDRNGKLKRLVANLTLDKKALQDALSKSWRSLAPSEESLDFYAESRLIATAGVFDDWIAAILLQVAGAIQAFGA